MTKQTRREYDAPNVKVVKFVVENGFGPYAQTEGYDAQDEITVSNEENSVFTYSFSNE